MSQEWLFHSAKYLKYLNDKKRAKKNLKKNLA